MIGDALREGISRERAATRQKKDFVEVTRLAEKVLDDYLYEADRRRGYAFKFTFSDATTGTTTW